MELDGSLNQLLLCGLPIDEECPAKLAVGEDDASQDNGDLTSKKESSKPSPGKRGRAPKFSLNELVEVNWKRGWYTARIIDNVGSYTVAYLSNTGAPAETERDVKRYRIRDPIGNCFIKPP